MPARRVSFVFLLAFALGVALSCSRRPGPLHPDGGGSEVTPPAEAARPSDGLTLRLRSASPEEDAIDRPALADAEPLSAAEVKTVLARLPALPKKSGDATKFAKRSESPPAPRTGATVVGAFPPKGKGGKAPRPKSKALSVVRFAPEGDVPLAPHLSVTFNQAMVGITSHAELASEDAPVTLSPQPAGQWRWVGTKTLVFSPKERFPMATTYKVEVPKGSKSATGAKLAKGKSFSFATPPLKLLDQYPASMPTKRQPLIFMSFDQRIDRKAVLEHAKLRVGRKDVPLRLAKRREIEADEVIAARVHSATKGRFVVATPVRTLPADTQVEVVLAAGTPSAEGPRVTVKPQGQGFRTYGPMDVADHECGYRGDCPPGTAFAIEFTNPIDASGFDNAMVKVEPELEGKTIQVYDSQLYIVGRGKGRTKYTVTLSPKLPDTFGQTLGKNKPLTFKVTKAPEQLWSNGGPLVTLDPSGPRTFAVNVVNYKKVNVEIYAVEPSDWGAYLKYLSEYDKPGKHPPGRKVASQTVKTGVPRDEVGELALDVSAALKSGFGHAIVVAEGNRFLPDRDPGRAIAWVQSTAIGLSAFVDPTGLVGWATDLQTGAPKAGVALDLVPGTSKGKTDGDGLARLGLSAKTGAQLVLAREGKDVAFVPQQTWFWNIEQGWKKEKQRDTTNFFVFDDRQMYKPGETMRFKGWVRRIEGGKGGDVVTASVREVSYSLKGARGNELRKGKLRVGRLGSFDGKLEIPKDANLGNASLIITAPDGMNHWHSFKIQEFRRPEYEVKVAANQGPHRVGGSARLTAEAAYYAGGPLQNADVEWAVIATETTFTPPNRSEFKFGRFRPWWMWWVPGEAHKEPKRHVLKGKTDGSGKHVVVADFVAAEPALPFSVYAQGTVWDVNRQAWSDGVPIIVHPGEVYVGVKTERRFVEKGQPIELGGVVVDIDGKSVKGRDVVVKAVRLTYEQKGTEQVEVEHDAQTCKAKTATFDCEFETKDGGLYRLRAVVKDRHGNRSLTEIRTWVLGGDIPQSRGVEQERATLITDRDDYAAGDTVKLLVVSPFADAHGVLTLGRSGLEEVRPFTMKGTSHALEIKAEHRFTPTVALSVDLVGAKARRDAEGKIDPKLPKRPAYAAGSYQLSVPPTDRKITVEARPREAAVEPGGKTSVAVKLTDHRGKPVADADVAVVVVDEAVLALSGYSTPDPLAAFYFGRLSGVAGFHSRSGVQLADSTTVTFGYGGSGGGAVGGMVSGNLSSRSAGDAPGFGEKGKGVLMPPPAPPPEPAPAQQTETTLKRGEPPGPAIAIRSNFDALALFEASERTGADGRVSVEVEVPDNLTRYRIMVVAAAGEHDFGSGEATLTARLPLMVRPSPPRFLNFGDRFELPIVVQNQTNNPMEVKLAARATNLELTKGQGRKFTVPPNERREVRLPAKTASPGTARFQVAASAGAFADGTMLELPVWTPATTEAFATYGEIDKGAIVQPVKAPEGVFRQFGGLEITTSSTAVSALTDAVVYLVEYPFQCTEQIGSRVLAIAALRDVLDAFDADGLPKPKKLEAAVKRDLDWLSRRQRNDGGFGFWRRDSAPWPYLGVHVAHAFARAQAKGFKVPGRALKRSKDYIGAIEKHIPKWYGDKARWAIQAYALHVRHLFGDDDRGKAKKLWRRAGLDELPLEAQGWLLPLLDADAVKKTRRHLDNRVTETAAAAHFADGYSDNAHVLLHSNRRADGVLLEALVETAPKSDVIPKLVRGLLAHRKAGRWSSTQETTFVLLALDAYFQRFEKATPDFVAKAWLGERYAGSHKFKGRTTQRQQIDVPMRDVGTGDLVLSKTGKGRMYYRVGMKYAPSDLKLPPADHGFAVQRVYEPVDDKADVRRAKDGTWKIKAGARVRVRVTMVAPARRYHVALIDPLPAGLEALNPALAVTGKLPQDPKAANKKGRFWWWWGTWYEHQSMRDERAEAFASLLWEGVHEYTYVARATTPGEFVVPPAKAEEMYTPETFGRSAVDRVVVK